MNTQGRPGGGTGLEESHPTSVIFVSLFSLLCNLSILSTHCLIYNLKIHQNQVFFSKQDSNVATESCIRHIPIFSVLRGLKHVRPELLELVHLRNSTLLAAGEYLALYFCSFYAFIFLDDLGRPGAAEHMLKETEECHRTFTCVHFFLYI